MGDAPEDLARWVDGLVEGRRGELVQEKSERRVWRVQDGRRVWFAKRGVGSKRGEIFREADNARALEAADFGPPVLASGVHGGAAWIVTAAADGLPLTLIGMFRQASDGELLRAVVRGIRKFHDAGFGFADLTTEHVFASVAGDRIFVIDAARLEFRAAPTPPAMRARDLAAFLLSCHDAWDSAAWRIRFLRDATGLHGADLRELGAAVERNILRLVARTRWRHRFERMTGEFRTAFWATFEEDAWSHRFEDLISPEHFDVVRTLPDRENRTLGRGPDGRPLFFVKLFPPTRSAWSPAMRELAAIDRFQRAGILVNRVAAYAEDVDLGSVVAVKACAGEPLDDFLRRGVPRAERRVLAVETARIWRRMRDRGLRHRDAYACHAFVARTDDPRRPEIRLIDLTRAGPAPWPRARWFVKDAAQLWHGARPAGATRTDAVAWLREYCRVPRLTGAAKRFARRVAAKEASIAARQARKARSADG